MTIDIHSFIYGVGVVALYMSILYGLYILGKTALQRQVLRKLFLRLTHRRVVPPCRRCGGEGETPATGLGDLPTLAWECVDCQGDGVQPAFYEPRWGEIPLDPSARTIEANHLLGGSIDGYKREQAERLGTPMV